MRGIGPAEGREHVEGPGLEVVASEHDGPLALQVAGQPGDPGEHLERRHVDVGQRPTPAHHQTVNLVFHLILPEWDLTHTIS